MGVLGSPSEVSPNIRSPDSRPFSEIKNWSFQTPPDSRHPGPFMISALYRLIWPPVRRVTGDISLPEEITGRLVMVLRSEWCLKFVS
jgi:hypothetical protein